MPAALTPEILLKGHELISANIVPGISSVEPEIVDDPSWEPTVKTTTAEILKGSEKLQKCREILRNLYHEEFLSNYIIIIVCQNDKVTSKVNFIHLYDIFEETQ